MDLLRLSERFALRTAATAGGTVSWRESAALPGRPPRQQGASPSGAAPPGRDTPLVLLHGIGSGSGSWLHQLDRLGGSRRVLAWDAPGYGSSAPLPMAAPGAHDYARRLWQWLDALALAESVVLAGHSLGALMAAAAAGLQPQRVARLVLLSPARGYGQAEPAQRERTREQRLHRLRTLGPESMARERGAAMLSPGASPALLAYVQAIMAQVHPAGYTQATHMLAQADLASLLAELCCPVQVASGAADTITPPAACEALARQAGCPYRSLGEVGHACALEAPDAVCDLLGGDRL